MALFSWVSEKSVSIEIKLGVSAYLLEVAMMIYGFVGYLNGQLNWCFDTVPSCNMVIHWRSVMECSHVPFHGLLSSDSLGNHFSAFSTFSNKPDRPQTKPLEAEGWHSTADCELHVTLMSDIVYLLGLLVERLVEIRCRSLYLTVPATFQLPHSAVGAV